MFMFKEKLGVIVLTSPSLPMHYGLFLGSAKFSSIINSLISSHHQLAALLIIVEQTGTTALLSVQQ